MAAAKPAAKPAAPAAAAPAAPAGKPAAAPGGKPAAKPAAGGKKPAAGGGKKTVAKKNAYKVDGNKVERIKPTCPKCGPGIFMAAHKDRVSCGKCGYTEFKKKE